MLENIIGVGFILIMIGIVVYSKYDKNRKRKDKKMVKVPPEAPVAAKYPALTGAEFKWKPVSESRGGVPVVVFNHGLKYQDNSMRLELGNGRVIYPTEFIAAADNDNDRDLVFFGNIKAAHLVGKRPVLFWNGNSGYEIVNPTATIGQ